MGATAKIDFSSLAKTLEGELLYDTLSKALYATDASVYRILPQAVAFPKNAKDLQKLIVFALKNKTSLIPRTAGTSLAGQCVGDGIVVDVSKHFNQIMEVDVEKATIVVQPGIIRDILNIQLQPHDLFFAPNTSTSNRCMIGGMVGNNSSGTTSIKYGVTRDKILEIEAVLSDGSIVVFKELSAEEFFTKTKQENLEGKIYQTIYTLLKESVVQERIKKEFPKPEIHRRNTGYAIDELIKSEIFTPNGNRFNMCKLLCGSEGTLAFTTKIKLQLDPIPPKESVLVVAHFDSIEKCLKAVVPSMQHHLDTCEMIDKVVMDCTKGNLKYKDSRFFIVGDPQAVLMLELKDYTVENLQLRLEKLLAHLTETNLAYALPVLYGSEIEKAIDLRKAGLGLLGNMIGDKKAVPCIEDTAVALSDLSNYIDEFTALMKAFGQEAVYYAHAGAGELHLRPILNLKKQEDVELFEKITTSVAHLVKKYQGSMSGEHGDGIVRSQFIEMMIGSENYKIIKEIKTVFDPNFIFNRGKIIEAFPIKENLRYQPDRVEPEVKTIFDFSDSMGILRAAEQCNGSGDCRKPESFGGTMCPSYRVTKNEKDTTRGRANVLREFLTHSNKTNRFNHQELKDVFDLCIGCKGCKSECPSNVDVATLKAEFEYQYQKENGKKIRTKIFAHNHQFNLWAKKLPEVSNFIFSNTVTSHFIKKMSGISLKRELPRVSKKNIYKEHQNIVNKGKNYIKEIYFFVDEFTECIDTEIGIDAMKLLDRLGYKVLLIKHSQSGRAFISKGFLEEAKKCANKNIEIFKNIISEETPLIGIEPSTILTFRDEYLRLADNKEMAINIAKNTFTIEEFLDKEISEGTIKNDAFTQEEKQIKLHLHCHQKALSSVLPTFNLLNLPKNYQVTVIPSGCCGMAGSFGYEKEHEEISMQMGELTLFPAIRKISLETVIAATGTSCRHQIKDGTNRAALHPVTILRRALL